MLQVNNEWVYEDLTPESTVELLKAWERGEEPQVGPQNGRINSLGPMGRTSLENIPNGDSACHGRDWGAELQKWKDAKEAAAKK